MANYTFFFNDHQAGDTYQWISPAGTVLLTEGVVTTLPGGGPMVEHVTYIIDRLPSATAEAYRYSFRFEGDSLVSVPGGEDAAKSGVPSLAQVAKVGGVTGQELTVGGLKSYSWPSTTDSGYWFVLGPDGTVCIEPIPATATPPPPNTPTTYEVIGIFELVPITTPPNAPTNLTASRINSSGRTVRLNWTDNSPNESRFEVLAADAQAGAYTLLTTVGADVTTLDLAETRLDTPLWYQVVAVNDAGRSDAATVSITLTAIVSTLKATFYLADNGEPPINETFIIKNQSYYRKPEGQHIGVRITDAAGNVPTGAYSGLELRVYDAATGLTTGITTPDQSIKPSAGIVWAYPRPNGPVFGVTSLTLSCRVVDGPTEIQRFETAMLLIANASLNHLPNAVTVADIAITTGVAYSVTLPVITDPDPGDTITYSVVPVPTGWAFSPTTRVLSVTQANNTTPSDAYLQYIGLDSQGGQRPNSFRLTVSAPVSANRPPTAPSPLPTLVFQRGPVTFYDLPPFTDPDPGDYVSLIVTSLPSWLDFYPSGSLSDGISPWLVVKTGGVPTSAVSGTLTYTGTDNHGAATSVSLPYTVINAN